MTSFKIDDKNNVILDNVYYINLDERKDRKIHVEKELNELKWNYTRFNAIKAHSGRVGCSMSHLKLLMMAKEKKMPYIVIIEDDILFTDKAKFNTLLRNFLEGNIDFDVLLLAGNLRNPIKKITNNILKVYRSFTTTGYIVKEHYYDKIINNIKYGLNNLIKNPESHTLYAIDVIWMKLQQSDNWFICYPRTVTQLPDYSNIENTYVDYNHLMLDKNYN